MRLCRDSRFDSSAIFGSKEITRALGANLLNESAEIPWLAPISRIKLLESLIKWCRALYVGSCGKNKLVACNVFQAIFQIFGCPSIADFKMFFIIGQSFLTTAQMTICMNDLGILSFRCQFDISSQIVMNQFNRSRITINCLLCAWLAKIKT